MRDRHFYGSTHLLHATRMVTTALLFILWALPVQAQVSISPTSIFLQDRAPFANVIVSNGSSDAQEVSIRFDFGYSVSDEGGNVSMSYPDEENEQDLTDHLNAFPRNFILEPGQRQTIRIAVRGLNQEEDGTYWSRVRILASPMAPPLEAMADQQTVSARININFEQVIPVSFRKGNVTTGVTLHEIDFQQEGPENGHFLIHMEREGNSPFVGSVTTRIRDARGRQVLEQMSNISLYYELNRRFPVDLAELPAGDYEVTVLVRSDRRDISSGNLIQVEPIQRIQSFRVE
ncbi:MAG: hypothetical protein WEA36_09455 [Balneolaceae bacterium]